MSEQVTMQTKDVIDRIFKEPGIQYELTEFETLGKPIHEIIRIYPKVVTTGKEAGKTKYFLKIYMNAKGAPVAVWSNGADSIILYRPYPAQFDDTLFDLPRRGQEPKDVLEDGPFLSHKIIGTTKFLSYKNQPGS